MPVTGLTELYAAIDRITEAGVQAAKSVVGTGAAMLTAEAQANFQGSHKKGQPHVGGDRPNVVSGYLRRSIQFTPPQRLGTFEYSSQIGPTAVYGRAVELGYAARNVRPHPYFEPAARTVTDRLPALAASTWLRFLR